MNLRRLAIKNVWQNRGRYLAYFGSAAFSVMIYFLYTAVALHPDLRAGFAGASYVAKAMRASAVVIAIFTLLFLLYSSVAFVRSRTKEFGLLSLLGLTRGQLVRMLLWENVLIAAAAVAAGLGLGVLFLKLFFMAVSALLQLPGQLPVYVGWPVWRRTLLVFGAMFLFVSLLSLRGVLGRSIIELIRAGRKPLERPTFSKTKALLGTALVLGGYAWASIPTPNIVILGIVPVTTMVSAGTYFVLREASVALLLALRRMRRLYERAGLLLTVGRLVFKLQENYRVLSGAAIMVAVILSAMGTILTAYVVTEEAALNAAPQALQLHLPEDEASSPHVSFIEETLAAHGVDGLQAVSMRLPVAVAGDSTVLVAPYSIYKTLYRPQGQVVSLDGGADAVLVRRFSGTGDSGDAAPTPLIVSVDETEYTLSVRIDATGRLLNDALDVLIVGDDRYERWVRDHADAPFRTVIAWTGPGWRAPGMADALSELRTRYGTEGDIRLTTAYESHRATITQFGLALFVGLFISLVFFAATCSLLYFRLFTEIDEDRRYYTRLRQLGLTFGELRRLARTQALIVFAVPFVVGLIHSTFAMRALGTLVMRSVLHYGWMMAAGYLILYGAFFSATFAVYWQAIGLRESVAAADGAERWYRRAT